MDFNNSEIRKVKEHSSTFAIVGASCSVEDFVIAWL
jgi:hypothetical protein